MSEKKLKEKLREIYRLHGYKASEYGGNVTVLSFDDLLYWLNDDTKEPFSLWGHKDDESL